MFGGIHFDDFTQHMLHLQSIRRVELRITFQFLPARSGHLQQVRLFASHIYKNDQLRPRFRIATLHFLQIDQRVARQIVVRGHIDNDGTVDRKPFGIIILVAGYCKNQSDEQ
jgi:hypothetical protein